VTAPARSQVTPTETKAISVLLVRPALGQGGADRVTRTLLERLPRDRFALSLALLQPRGELLEGLPPDVAVHSLGGVRLWQAVVPLAKLLRQVRPDVLFSTSGGTNVVAVLARRLSGCRPRLVLSERNAQVRARRSWKDPVMRWLKGRTYARADVVTAVSEGVARELTDELGVPPERVKVVYNPVVTPGLLAQAQEPLDHPWFAGDAPVVLACGRLVPQKDYPTLLRAFRAVRDAGAARLVILGEGPEEGTLREMVADLGLEPDVWFAGFDVNPFRYMARCSCFVLSSRHEGLPGALIQAMACGAAVVSTDCPHGPAEVVTDGVDGFLVPVGDAAALAARVSAVLADPALGDDLRARATEKVAHFAMEDSLALYAATLVAEPRARSHG
jgi:glycosyltransferase involved in cell wall biosynthesis